MSLSFQKIAPTVDTGWQEWSDFVSKLPTAGFYQSREWLRNVCEGMAQEIVVHVALAAGEVVAGAVVRRSCRFGIAIAQKPRATAYTGPFCLPNHQEAAVELVREMLREYKVIRLVTAPGALLPNEPQHWARLDQKQTPVLIADKEGALWESFDRRVRQRVRKAQRLGVIVHEASNTTDFFALYKHTYAAHGLPMPLKAEAVEAVLSPLLMDGRVQIYVARTAEGCAAAATVVGVDTRRAYFLLAGSHPIYRKTDAMSLLWWEIIRLHCRTHAEIDFVGYGIDSVDRFKRAFRPESRNHWQMLLRAKGPSGIFVSGALALRKWVQFQK